MKQNRNEEQIRYRRQRLWRRWRTKCKEFGDVENPYVSEKCRKDIFRTWNVCARLWRSRSCIWNGAHSTKAHVAWILITKLLMLIRTHSIRKIVTSWRKELGPRAERKWQVYFRGFISVLSAAKWMTWKKSTNEWNLCIFVTLIGEFERFDGGAMISAWATASHRWWCCPDKIIISSVMELFVKKQSKPVSPHSECGTSAGQPNRLGLGLHYPWTWHSLARILIKKPLNIARLAKN